PRLAVAHAVHHAGVLRLHRGRTHAPDGTSVGGRAAGSHHHTGGRTRALTTSKGRRRSSVTDARDARAHVCAQSHKGIVSILHRYGLVSGLALIVAVAAAC